MKTENRCESCGGRIDRGYGKVCSECEKEIGKMLEEAKENIQSI